MSDQEPEDQEQKKDQLLKIWAEVQPQAEHLEALGGEIIKAARLARDIAGPIYDYVSLLPAESLPADQARRFMQSGGAVLGAARNLIQLQTSVNTFVAVTMNTASTESFVNFSGLRLPPAMVPRIEVIAGRFHAALAHYPLVEETEAAMRRLRLDTGRPGAQTPLELLTEARGALEKPVAPTGGALAVLLSLRGCIESALNELTQRRETPERAKHWDGKIESLGRQCARPGLDGDHFGRLAASARRVNDELSGSKRSDMSRDELTAFFNSGLVFLNSLLSALDETLLKPPTRG